MHITIKNKKDNGVANMKYKDRLGNEFITDSSQEMVLQKLYGSVAGRCILKVLTRPVISKIAGSFLDTRLSCILNKKFIESNNIDTSQFVMKGHKSFNDCFTRQIKPGMREIDMNPEHLISPCDCKVTAHKISEGNTFEVKNSVYTVESLLRDAKLANKFAEGNIIILRLSVDDYHRYCYIDDGVKSRNRFIKGVLHTVNPIATKYARIYSENSREYTLLHTKHLGDIIQIEVGALLVGRIKNHHGRYNFERGEEKGMFEYGGSTIILITNKDVAVDYDIINNTNEGFETKVKMGEKIGYLKK